MQIAICSADSYKALVGQGQRVVLHLESGNIGYEIARRIGGAAAIGPVVQGLVQPANNLARGCSAEDVLHMIAVTSLQASRMKEAGDAC